jgi:hypothetical protein
VGRSGLTKREATKDTATNNVARTSITAIGK